MTKLCSFSFLFAHFYLFVLFLSLGYRRWIYTWRPTRGRMKLYLCKSIIIVILFAFPANDKAPVKLRACPIRKNDHRSINSLRYIRAVLAFPLIWFSIRSNANINGFVHNCRTSMLFSTFIFDSTAVRIFMWILTWV